MCLPPPLVASTFKAHLEEITTLRTDLRQLLPAGHAPVLWGCMDFKSETHPHLQVPLTSQLKVPVPVSMKGLISAVPDMLSLMAL